jgi:hypothetical protein
MLTLKLNFISAPNYDRRGVSSWRKGKKEEEKPSWKAGRKSTVRENRLLFFFPSHFVVVYDTKKKKSEKELT